MKIGIIGAGQLAQMLATAAIPLGMKVHCIADTMSDCAEPVADLFIIDHTDEEGLLAFAESVDIITFENENIPTGVLELLSDTKPTYPPMTALATAQDRLYEKNTFKELDIVTTEYHDICSKAELDSAIKHIGLPAVLKTRRFGYDGKGQAIIRNQKDADKAFEALGKHQLILEEFVDFDYEVSLIAVRNGRGDFAYYPLTLNVHRNGILRQSDAPFEDTELQLQAERYAKVLLDHFNYVGTLAIEFFVKEGLLIANEIAPRVHNSGHWTIEGCVCSQFENHIRAICNLSLGSTKLKSRTRMYNIIGSAPRLDELLSIPDAHVHLYGKEPKPGRKLGHVTLTDNTHSDFEQECQRVHDLLNEKVNA